VRNSTYLSVRFSLGNGALPRESLVLWPSTEKWIIHVCSHAVKRKILWKRSLKNLDEGRGEQRKRKIKERTWKLVLKVSHNLFQGFFFPPSFSFCTHLLLSFSCFLPPYLSRALQASDHPSQLPCWTRILLGFWNIHTNGIRELPSAKRSGIVTAGDGLRIANPSSPYSD